MSEAPDSRPKSGRAGRSRNRKRAGRTSSAPPREKRPRRLRRVPLWQLAAAIGVAVLLTAVGVALYGSWSWTKQGREDSGFVAIEVVAGQNLEAVADSLVEKGLVDSANLFTLYGVLRGSDVGIEPGPHWLPRGSSPERLLALLTRKQNRPRAKVPLPEGWDSFQIAERLEGAGICAGKEFLRIVHAAGSAEALGLPGAGPQTGNAPTPISLEGYLYPSTYEFSWDTDPKSVVQRLVTEADGRFKPVFENAALAATGLSAHELVIMGSMILKEARDMNEIPLIASVFFNRLNDPEFRPRRMLQSDPTAGYGCKLPDAPASCANYSGRITPELLRDGQNRYNTYRQAGLPPGPISNPSAEVLSAILTAPKTRYYFFVAGRDGHHRFSESLAEHERSIGQ